MNITHASERQFCRQFEAIAVTDRALQYKDIDAKKVRWVQTNGEWVKHTITYSIKCQKIAQETGNFSFENKLINSRTGEWKLGNFPICKADYVVISDNKDWYFFDRVALHNWMRENSSKYPRKGISYYLKMDNQKQGRTYDDAENILVPIKDLEHLVLKKIVHKKRLPKGYKLSEQNY